MAPKRKSSPTAINNPNTNKRHKNGNDDKIPYIYIPDLVIHHILALLPSRFAAQAATVSKQWAAVWASIAVLDLDDGDLQFPSPIDLENHDKFVSFVDSYLNRRRRELDPLDKFRIRMTYLPDDGEHLDEWLRFAVERKVKELDIGLRGIDAASQIDYQLPKTFFNAKYLTRLNLELMKFDANFSSDHQPITFPCLKSMSFEWVDFEGHSLSDLISWCPSLDLLWLDSCNVGALINESLIESPTLRSCEFLHCVYVNLRIDAANLERFIFVSAFDLFNNQSVTLADCPNLKHIDISGQFLHHLRLYGLCQENVEGQIYAPNLRSFDFGGFLVGNTHLVTSPFEHLVEAGIYLVDQRQGPVFSWPLNYFSDLRDLLANLSYAEKLTLYAHDQEGFLFPENLRWAYSSPLPNVKQLEILMSYALEERVCDLRDSLRWLAPSVENPVIKLVEK